MTPARWWTQFTFAWLVIGTMHRVDSEASEGANGRRN